MEVGEVVEHLLKNAEWTASRSSGPGGQHRDKASTRAELTVGLDTLAGLEPTVAARLAEALGLEDKPLRIQVQEEQSLSRNQEIAGERLAERVARALAPPAPPRRQRARAALGAKRAWLQKGPPRRHQAAPPATDRRLSSFR